MSSTKTNYWSTKLSFLNEQSQKQLAGDGIPLVRRLLPAHKKSQKSKAVTKKDVSLVSYLIEKSKSEVLLSQKQQPVSASKTPEILFSENEPGFGHFVHRSSSKPKSNPKNPGSCLENSKEYGFSPNSRNKNFPDPRGRNFGRGYQNPTAKNPLRNRKNLMTHYKFFRRNPKRNLDKK